MKTVWCMQPIAINSRYCVVKKVVKSDQYGNKSNNFELQKIIVQSDATSSVHSF